MVIMATGTAVRMGVIVATGAVLPVVLMVYADFGTGLYAADDCLHLIHQRIGIFCTDTQLTGHKGDGCSLHTGQLADGSFHFGGTVGAAQAG
jgi:hypothetical protein